MLAFLTRRRTEETDVPATETTNASGETTDNDGVMLFLTQGGAVVRVTKAGTFERRGLTHNFSYGVQNHRWRCLGCDDGSDSYTRLDESAARSAANGHAATCRAMPKPTA